MISKELLSEVLGYRVLSNILIQEEIIIKLNFEYFQTKYENDEINIYELAHKCKEWAWLQGFMLSSGFSDSEWFCEYLQIDNDYINDYFLSDSEPEAIFKACEWILKKESGCSE